MLTRWSDLNRTVSMLDELQYRMNGLFEGYGSERRFVAPATQAGSWPPVNIYDAEDEFLIEAMVPGLSDNDIRITGNRDVLTISGERHVKTPEGYSVHRKERSGLKFSRSFTFPCPIDLERASAAVKDGLLLVRLAKAEEAKPRKVEVKAL